MPRELQKNTSPLKPQNLVMSIFPFIIEIGMPLLAIILIMMGWGLAMGYKNTLVNTVISSYHETQLEIVRSIARSIQPFVEDRLTKGLVIQEIEQEIFKRFVAPVHLLKNGDAWIYTPDHVVFDLSSDFPEIYRGKSMDQIFEIQKDKGAYHYEQMAADIRKAHEGIGWYVWLPEKGREIAAWSPVAFGHHIWNIGLSTPLNEILLATGAQANIRIIFIVMFVVTFFVGGLSMTSLLGGKRRRQLHRILEKRNATLQELVSNLEHEVAMRTETETAARQINTQLNALIEAIPDVICFKDSQLRNVIVNRAYEKLTGIDKNEVLGRTDFETLPAELAEAFRKNDQKVFESQIPLRYEEDITKKDGEIICFDTYKAPLVDEQQDVLGLVGVRRDVTAFKLAEKERERLGQQLLHAQKMEAIGNLAGGVAHDLNNILSGLVSYPDLLIYDLPDGSTLRGPLKTIQLSGERAASIVQDLLTMARRGTSEKYLLNINSVINEYLDSPSHRKRIMERPEVSMEQQLASDLMNIKGTASDLSKTVMNLLINAFEAIIGPGTITLKTSNEYIDAKKVGLTDVSEGEYVRLRVRDSGKGIDEEHLPRIFEPFYTKKKMGSSGTGLGLAVVWGTVQDHGGVIDVKSVKGSGTTFDIYFPAIRQEISFNEDRVPFENYRGRGERILVVDDIDMQCEIASNMLEKLGYVVHTVNNGEAAIECVEQNAFDLIVLDMIMGEGMDGLDTYRRLIEQYPSQKAVITSGFSENERVWEAQRLGAGTYIKKPFRIETLGIAVRFELDKPNE